MRIDVRGSKELQDVAIALQGMDRNLKRYIRAQTKAKMTTPWLEAIQSRASTSLERRVIASTATVATSDQNIRIQSAAKGRRLPGGLNPKTEYPAVEFGADRQKKNTYTRQGTRVTRHTARQMKPRNRKGYVFYPAAREMIPRLASLWVQTIVRTVADIFEGRI